VSYRAPAEVEADPIVAEPELPDEEPGPMVGRGSGVLPGEWPRVSGWRAALVVGLTLLMVAGGVVVMLPR